MAKKKRSRFVSQAALEALVRFGPELSGLKELERQAQENFVTGVKQAHGTAAGIMGAVDRARPTVKKVYDSEGLQQAKTASMVGTDIAALSNVAPSIRAGAQVEASAAASKLGDARAAALTDLSSRKVQAKEGETYAVNNARSEFIDAITKVLNRKTDLGAESGAFTASTARELRLAEQGRQDKLKINADDNSQSERNSLRTAGINPDTGQPIPGGKADPKAKGAKPATRAEHDKVESTVGSGTTTAQKLLDRDPTISRADLEKSLAVGQKPQPLYETVKDKRTGKTTQKRVLNPDGTQAVTEEIPKIDSPLLRAVALDVAYDGHLSKRNQAALHKRGLSIKQLGLPSYGEWKKKNVAAQRKGKARNKAAGGKLYGPAF